MNEPSFIKTFINGSDKIIIRRLEDRVILTLSVREGRNVAQTELSLTQLTGIAETLKELSQDLWKTSVPDGNAKSFVDRIRRMDKDYGWANSDQLSRTAQYISVSDNTNYWRVLEFAELWYLLNGKKIPDVKNVRELMEKYPTIFLDGIGSASELINYGSTYQSGGSELFLKDLI